MSEVDRLDNGYVRGVLELSCLIFSLLTQMFKFILIKTR